MMKYILGFCTLVVLFTACKDEEKEQVIQLDTFKKKLSYTLGADHAKSISESGDPNFAKYDLVELIDGFKEGLKSQSGFEQDCQESFMKMFGENGQKFNQKYAKEGSSCIGKLSGLFFKNGWEMRGAIDKIDLKYVIIGFEQGLKKIDTLVKRDEQIQIVSNFIFDINKVNGQKIIDQAKKLPNTQTTASGLVLQTLQAGKGGKPSQGDDILAQYMVINALGDTIENSFKIAEITKQPPRPFSLLEVVPGWQEGIAMMEKGGKYKLYLPYHLAYGDQGQTDPRTGAMVIQPYETLTFYIELLNFGKPGSLTKK